MPRLKILSGRDVIEILKEFGFEPVSQRGSHIKLRRIRKDTQAQNLTVPDHREIDRGTLHAIYRQASRYISESELRPHFYTS